MLSSSRWHLLETDKTNEKRHFLKFYQMWQLKTHFGIFVNTVIVPIYDNIDRKTKS